MNVRIAVAVVAAASAALAVPGLARAEERPPAIDQYVEHIPTSSGSQATGGSRPDRSTAPTGRRAAPTGRGSAASGGTGTESPVGVAPLPAAVERKLRAEGGSDGALLRRIATSPELGAPERVHVGKAERARLSEVRREQAAQPLSAAVGAVAGTGDGRVLALAIAMGVMTAVAVAAAGRKRRAARSSRSR
jgi:hypothetical protein